MSDAKLMMPLFCNGMFNCGGRRIRAVHLYDVSDGEHRYRLWTKACSNRLSLRHGDPVQRGFGQVGSSACLFI